MLSVSWFLHICLSIFTLIVFFRCTTLHLPFCISEKKNHTLGYLSKLLHQYIGINQFASQTYSLLNMWLRRIYVIGEKDCFFCTGERVIDAFESSTERKAYSPDVAPSDFFIFRSIAHSLIYEHFRSYKEVQNWISWITSKYKQFIGT